MNPTHFTFVVTDAQANQILNTLAAQPYNTVAPLIADLQNQVNKQLARPAAPAIVPPEVDGA